MDIIKQLNGWSKLLIILIPIVIGGLIGYGKLQKNVEHIDATKASVEQVARIDERLKNIEKNIDEIKRDIREIIKK